MRPGFTQLNTANMGLANAKLSGQTLLGESGCSDLFNVFLRELGVIVLFSLFVVCVVSALVHHVPNIISMGPHGEMFGVDARRVVTRMHNLHSFGDRDLVFDHPRNPVSRVHLPLVVINAELALSLPILRGQPQPTIIGRGFLNFTPKSTEKRFIKHEAYIHGSENDFKFRVI